jgi:hypothetical protein
MKTSMVRRFLPSATSRNPISILALLLLLIAGTESQAQMQYYKHLSGSTESSIRDMVASPEVYEGVIITGRFSGTIDFNTGGGSPVIRTAVGRADMFVAQYSTTGTLNWVKTFGSATSPTVVEGSSITLTNDHIVPGDIAVGNFGIILNGSILNPNFNGTRTVDFNPSAAGGELTTNNSQGNGFVVSLNGNNGAFYGAKLFGDQLGAGASVRKMRHPADVYHITYTIFPDKIYVIPDFASNTVISHDFSGGRRIEEDPMIPGAMVIGGSNVNGSGKPFAVVAQVADYPPVVKGYFGELGKTVMDMVVSATSSTTLAVYATIYSNPISSPYTFEVQKYNITITSGTVTTSLAWKKVVKYNIQGSPTGFLALGGGNLFLGGWFQGTTDFNYSGTPGGVVKNVTSSNGGVDVNSCLASYNATTGACNWAGANSAPGGWGACVGLGAINSDVYFASNGAGTTNIKFSGTPTNINLGSFNTTSWLAKYTTNTTSVPARMAAASIYPNPASSVLKVDLDSGFVNGVITISDAKGKELRRQIVEKDRQGPFDMNLEGLPSGRYFVQIKGEGLTESKHIQINR